MTNKKIEENEVEIEYLKNRNKFYERNPEEIDRNKAEIKYLENKNGLLEGNK